MRGILAAVFLIFGLNFCFVRGIREYSIENQLYNDLFVNYNSKLRPLKGPDTNQQIVVHITFTLSQIEALNEQEEVLISHGGILLSWTDQLLQWNVSEYNGTRFMVLPADEIWLPELTAANSMKDAATIDETESRLRITSDGTVTWAPSLYWKTSCPVDVAAFPFDQQECEIEYAKWMYPADLVNYTVNDQVEVVMHESGGWILVEASARFDQFDVSGMPYPQVVMTLKLQRKTHHYWVNILIPTLLLSFLMIPMFILPVKSGERIAFGVTLMLSYCVFQMMLMQHTPQSGIAPNISIALLVSFVFAGVALFFNIIIVTVHYYKEENENCDCNIIRKLDWIFFSVYLIYFIIYFGVVLSKLL